MPRRGRRWILAALVLVAANLALQAGLHQGSLGNEVLTPRHQGSSDAIEYARAAGSIARGEGFTPAFGEGWRMPGYSLFLSPFLAWSEAPLRTARLAQIALTALIPLLFFFTLTRLTRSRKTAWVGASVAAVWVPLYHYSSALLAEAPSLFLVFLLLFGLSGLLASRNDGAGAGTTSRLARAAALGVILAALVYLKPNHLLLLLPVLGFLLLPGTNRESGRGRRAGIPKGNAIMVIVVTLALLAPWSIFISRRHGTFIPLTLVSGYNLYLGSGTVPIGDPEALPFRVAQWLGLQNAADGLARREVLEGSLSPASRDSAYTNRARTTWNERTGPVVMHGVAKVLHTFGFSFRGARDGVMVLFLLSVLAASGWLWRERKHRGWVLFLGLSLLGVALQAFLYLPNQRFKTVLFDPPALLILVLGMTCLWHKLKQRAGGRSTPVKT